MLESRRCKLRSVGLHSLCSYHVAGVGLGTRRVAQLRMRENWRQMEGLPEFLGIQLAGFSSPADLLAPGVFPSSEALNQTVGVELITLLLKAVG